MSIFDNGNKTGASPALADWTTNGNQQKLTLTGNVTGSPTFTDPASTGMQMLEVIQDGTGGRTMVWPTSVVWDKGVAPTLAIAASAKDFIFLYWDGTNYRGSAWSADTEVEVFKRVSGSNVTNSTTSFADITGLTFSVAANRNYRYKFVIFYTTNATTVAMNFAVNGPASPTAVVAGSFASNSTANVVSTGSKSAYDTAFTSNTNGPGATTAMAVIEGILRNGANAGTLAARFASETATLTTVLIDSYGVVTPF